MPDQPTQPNITPNAWPSVPVTGQAEDALRQQQGQAQQQRKSQAQIRQELLQKIAESKNPIFRRVYYKTIQRGALTTFQYMYWKHDPYPLVLCSGIYQDGRVAGVNLHYLTFKYIKYLIQQYCGKQFSYPLIKGNMYIYNAFRTYKRDGLRMTKLLDCEFLMTMLGSVRSFRPNEIEAIRQEVQRQLRARMNPTADDAVEEYTSTIVPDPRNQRYSNIEGYDPLERYGEPEWPRAVPSLKYPKPTLGDARRKPDNLLPPG
jgi:hypothetical protein